MTSTATCAPIPGWRSAGSSVVFAASDIQSAAHVAHGFQQMVDVGFTMPSRAADSQHGHRGRRGEHGVDVNSFIQKSVEELAHEGVVSDHNWDDGRDPLADLEANAAQPLAAAGRDHPGVVATATAALVLAVVILATSTGLILREYDRAETAKDNALTAAATAKTAQANAEAKEAESRRYLTSCRKEFSLRPGRRDWTAGWAGMSPCARLWKLRCR
jgi:hypothetical protein